MKVMFTSLLIFLLLIHHSSSSSSRRSLHQPFFPVIDSPPPPPPITAQPSPSPQPQLQPKHPFSSQTPPTLDHHHHFFPFYTSPSASTTTTPSISVPTFPANVSSSSIILPPPSSSSSSSSSKKLLALSLTLSLLSVAFIAAVLASLLYHRNHNPPTSDSIRLFPPNVPTSTDKPPPSPPTLPPNFSTPSSSEFLYLGTLVSPTPTPHQLPLKTFTNAPLGYKTLGSPELQPLPPLPRHHFPHHRNLDQVDDFFSPKTSPHAKGSTCFVDSTSTAYNRSSVSRMPSYLTSNPASPTHTRRVTLDLGPTSFSSNSPDAAVPIRLSKSPSLPAERYTHNTPMKLPPPPPPMPPPGFWETHVEVPEPTMGPTGAVVSELEPQEKEQRKDEILKPKLKALHWDKVRASSERAMAWDHLKFSSFQLNEEMIETLFTANSSSLAPKHSSINQENRVLDPYKSQNIAILLRAFNLTLDEVCESILQGNVDTLGTELLESLLKMAPTMEEQVRLKEYNDDASLFKLGPAEKFLKAVIDIPFAFKRVDAMLYISNFDTELDYLDRSFETIQSACQQLRNSRMFKKLLEAVLMSGNRMNVGTNRGDAHAFKLDTLLKLVDVKGTDGKTTLLHFVVQEIIRAEGYRLSGMDHDSTAQVNEQSALRDDVELRKAGLEVVYSLGGELSSVKKAAGMDFDMLSKEVRRLGMGMAKIGEVVALNGGSNEIFLDSMNKFLKKAEENIIKIEGQERVTISLVKETMEYFHGNSSAKEEAQPLRIFIVVKDFLGILDQVCKEVGRMNERTTVGSCGQASVFPSFNGKQPFGSSDD